MTKQCREVDDSQLLSPSKRPRLHNKVLEILQENLLEAQRVDDIVQQFKAKLSLQDEKPKNNDDEYYKSYDESRPITKIPKSEYENILETHCPYIITRQLGKGSYGQVYEAVNAETQEKIAIKFMSASRDMIVNEATNMAAVEHPYVVRLKDKIYYDSEKGQYQLVMELCEGTLKQYIPEGGLDEGNAARFFGQIADALAHCNQQGVAHFDVKPDNIFIGADKNVRLGDFGFSRTFTNPSKFWARIHGTPAYADPINWKVGLSSIESDRYSAGATLHYMLHGKLPKATGLKFYEMLDKRPRVDDPARAAYILEHGLRDNIADSAYDLMAQLANTDNRKARITFEEARNHPWIASGIHLEPLPLQRKQHE